MEKLNLYELVRVVKLLRPIPEYDSWGINTRAPQIGDIGTYIDLLISPGLPDHYIVESVGPDGVPIWLSEFTLDEIEPLRESS
jgi:hypothetical protein